VRLVSTRPPTPAWGLAFTRYCHYQYGMYCDKELSGGPLYCAIVWAMKGVGRGGGGGGAPKRGGVGEKKFFFLKKAQNIKKCF